MSDNVNLSQLLGASGITGAIIVVSYLGYKICMRKKMRSKCCGSEVDIQDSPAPETTNIINIPPPTPVAGTPVQTQPNPKEEPTGLAV